MENEREYDGGRHKNDRASDQTCPSLTQSTLYFSIGTTVFFLCYFQFLGNNCHNMIESSYFLPLGFEVELNVRRHKFALLQVLNPTIRVQKIKDPI